MNNTCRTTILIAVSLLLRTIKLRDGGSDGVQGTFVFEDHRVRVGARLRGCGDGYDFKVFYIGKGVREGPRAAPAVDPIDHQGGFRHGVRQCLLMLSSEGIIPL